MDKMIHTALPAVSDSVSLAVLVMALLVASFVRGFSGFGFSALVISATALFISPLVTIPMVMVWELFASLGQARKAIVNIDKKRVITLLAGAAIAMPVSITFLHSLNIDVVRAIIAGFVLVMCLLLLAGWALKTKVGTTSTFVAGMVSGFANGAAVGGLPIGLLMSAENIKPEIFRANMIAYLFALDFIGLSIWLIKGLLPWEVVQTAIVLLPFLMLGVWLGGRHFFATSPASFKRFVIILLMGLSVLSLGKSLF